MLGRIMDKVLRLFLPLVADEFVWCESLQSLEPLGEIVSHEKCGHMVTKLLVSIVVVAIDGSLP